MTPAGELGDAHELSERVRTYATTVIIGDEWPLTASHVDLSRVIFETSTRMQRTHGVCSYDGRGKSTIRLSESTYERAGFAALKETIRHELVHAYQQQTAGVKTGHGESFTEWVEPLDLSGRCSHHYDTPPDDYKYRFDCTQGCGFIGGRRQMCKTVRRVARGETVCQDCGSRDILVRDETGEAITPTEL
jgi:predicted SprT family Zn-dependent metalloprotease